MKKTLIIVLTLFWMMPSWALTIIGTVLGDNSKPLVGATVRALGTTTKVTTDRKGYYKIDVTSNDTQLEFSSSSYETKVYRADSVPNAGEIKLQKAIRIGGTCVPAENGIENASNFGQYVAGTSDNIVCKPDRCKCATHEISRQKDGSYQCLLSGEKNREGKPCKQNEIQDRNATKAIVVKWDQCTGKVEQCKITECKKDFVPNLDGSACISTKCKCGSDWNETTRQCEQWPTNAKCTSNTIPMLPPKATEAFLVCVNNEPACKVTRCEESFKPSEDAKQCVSMIDTKCVPSDEGITDASKSGIYVKSTKTGKLVCKPNSCQWNTYSVQEQSDGSFKCVLAKDRKGQACDWKEIKDPNAEKAVVEEWNENTGAVTKCKITKCKQGYVLNKQTNQCVQIGSRCNTTCNYCSPNGTYDDKLLCHPDSCTYTTHKAVINEYGDDYECIIVDENNRTNTSCFVDELKRYPHATRGTVSEWNHTTGIVTACTITKCEDGFKPSIDGSACISTKCNCGFEWDDTKRECVAWKQTECTDITNPRLPPNATRAKKVCVANEPTCEIIECNEFSKLSADKKQCISELGESCNVTGDTNASIAGQYVRVNNKKVCKPNSCSHPTYHVKQQDDGSFKCVFDESKERTGTPCNTDELSSYPNATAGVVKQWDKYTGNVQVCEITKCISGWSPDKQGTTCIEKKCDCGFEWDDTERSCVAWKEKSCDALNAAVTERICDANGNELCRIIECASGFYHNTDKNICVSTNGTECEIQDSHAAVATYDKDNKCVIRACEPGYDLDKKSHKCIEREKANIEELKQNLAEAKENETSLKNKLIGAAGIGVTGIGGMMIGEALSEQNADRAIENEMGAYINTFRCEYGNNPAVRGGTTNVELPGGNDLFNLYAQYATLSNDLKIRKEALGIKPGIESEVVWDKSETGLYDDVGTGIVAGRYASVARALLLGGADAAAWAAMKDATAEKLKTGIIVAGVGAVGSALANAQLNRHETAKKYSGLKEPAKKLEEAINSAPAPLCSDFPGTDGKGTTLDGCHCVNETERFFIDGGGCKPCEQSGFVYNEHNQCVCPFGQTTDENNKCVPVAPSCNLTGDVTAQCSCMSGADQNGTNCMCPYGSDSGKCKELTDVIELPTPIHDDIEIIEPDSEEEELVLDLSLTTDNTFTPNNWDLSPKALEALDNFKRDAKQRAIIGNFDLQKENDYCLIITGKTDRTTYPKNSPMNNKKLSQMRADAVKDKLKDTFNEKNILSRGIAEKDCTQEKYPNASAEECRRVDIKMDPAVTCSNYTE